MARLQDFPSVTPTSSDNLLIVQSQGQGLASVGSTLGAKMDKANPTGTGALSLNRKANTTVGTNSVAVGTNNEASNNNAFAEGSDTVAKGSASHAGGRGTISKFRSQNVFGEFNAEDPSTTTSTARGNYVEIVGKGANDANRSNARTLDWSGNEVLAGGLKLHTNQDAASFNLTGSIAANGTIDLSSYSDGTIIFVYRPSTSECGIYVKSTTWGAVLPIVTSSIVTVNGYVLTNTGSSAIRATIIAI